MKIKETKINDLLDVILNSVAKLSRHDYWDSMLWLKLGKWDKNDKADIQNAFVLKCVHDNLGVCVVPVGLCWGYLTDNEDTVERYLSKYDDIWEDYGKWCSEQR